MRNIFVGAGGFDLRSSETKSRRMTVVVALSLVLMFTATSLKECYLVDPASSHMLVSKIKPCMCKYELIQTVKLRMAH